MSATKSSLSPLVILFLQTCLVDGLKDAESSSFEIPKNTPDVLELLVEGSLVKSAIYQEGVDLWLHGDERLRDSEVLEKSLGIPSEDLRSALADWVLAPPGHQEELEDSPGGSGRPSRSRHPRLDGEAGREPESRRLHTDIEEHLVMDRIHHAGFAESFSKSRIFLRNDRKHFRDDKRRHPEREESFAYKVGHAESEISNWENDKTLPRKPEQLFSHQRRSSSFRVADDARDGETFDPQEAKCRLGHTTMEPLPVADRFFFRQSCFWCHAFVPPHRKNDDFRLDYKRDMVNINGEWYWDHQFSVQIGNESYRGHFDPNDPEAWDLVSQSLRSEDEAAKLGSCCADAMDCCFAMLQGGPAKEGWCPRTWDGWTCIPSDVRPDTDYLIRCPPYAYTGAPFCSLTGSKACTGKGTWHVEAGAEKTDYSTCDLRDVDVQQDTWAVVMTSVSLAFVCPSIVILLLFKKLRVQRFTLLLNLFAALFLKELFALVEVAHMTLPETLNTNSVVDDNGPGCRILVFLGKLASLAVWTWLLAEGLYLHRLIGAAFRGRINTWLLVGVGWGVPIPLALSWAIAKAVTEDMHCWLGSPNGSEIYLILEIPKLLIVLVNTGLLLDIARVLVTRLKNVNNDESANLKRACRATAFLLPLFGAQFLLTLVVPGNRTSCPAFQVYSFFSDAFDDLQGFYVSIAYCYTNREVQACLLREAARLSELFGSSTLESSTSTRRRRQQDELTLSTMNSANFKSDVTAASVVSND
ncbi:uncharacterized protein LOC143026822 [Oratosquilla oratoria]|uniref:uncharacterized protein LOC143026822 n=1 Tax=Oratosquilla oratoria TaxID=337810 RepID=UPI003F771FAB